MTRCLCCLWESLEWVWGSEFVCVCGVCVYVCVVCVLCVVCVCVGQLDRVWTSGCVSVGVWCVVSVCSVCVCGCVRVCVCVWCGVCVLV